MPHPLHPRLTAAAAAVGVSAALLLAPSAAQADPSDEAYIVVLKDGVTSSAAVADQHRRAHGAHVSRTYGTALKGYAARLSGTALAEVRRDRRVAYVERDGVARATAVASWGLDRVDQRTAALDGTYTAGGTGTGVTAYVVDSGIAPHAQFGSRLVAGHSTIADGRGTTDCDGHGTHVAGTVGGATYGVATAVTLVPVRVLDCAGSGSWSGVIAGLDWVAAHHTTGPAVANLSLGGGASSAVDAAVQRLVDDGVTVVVAAGNGNQAGVAQDACGTSPARLPAAVTIGATTRTDAKTSWSNYGSCVDFFAPGLDITSAGIAGTTSSAVMSGTSMAAPHVAGAAALYLESAPGASAATVRDVLYQRTTKAVVTSAASPNNHLLFTGTQTQALPTSGSGTTKPGKRTR